MVTPAGKGASAAGSVKRSEKNRRRSARTVNSGAILKWRKKMRKSKCLKTHYPESICMAERIVLFHGTRFRIALSVHEFYCEKCKKARHLWFINR